MRFLQHLGYLYALGAGLYAQAAVDAGGVGLAVPQHTLVAAARRLHVVVHGEIVVVLEDLRNVYALGTGHAVAAFGAPDGDPIQVYRSNAVDQGEFLNREEAVEELLSTGLKAYKTSGPLEDEDEPGALEEDGMMGHEDEYVF